MTSTAPSLRWTAPVPRIIRFGAVGITCGGLQLALLHVLVQEGLASALANGLAFGISAQVNFCLSLLVTWPDRSRDSWGPRLFRFNTAVLVGAAINEAVFVALDPVAHYLLASMAGIAAGAAFNFTAAARWVFVGQPLGGA